VQATFLLGPAGSGKTHRCLAEIRADLLASAAGLPLVLIAPKQATFQLERQLLADASLPGYTRLQILSFERLAEFVLAEFAAVPPQLLDEAGRVMVLRALLAQKQKELKIFRATARLPGFAQQLSLLLRELQRHRHSPETLGALAANLNPPSQVGDKLSDLSLLLRAYLDWLKQHHVQDADGLLDLATEALTSRLPSAIRHSPIRLSGLWLDGFAEMTPQELEFLAALAPYCARATLAFCLEGAPEEDSAWFSTWALVSRTWRNCRRRLAALPGCKVAVEVLERRPGRGRFADNVALAHLEEHWTRPAEFTSETIAAAPASASAPGSPATSSAQFELEFEQAPTREHVFFPELKESIRVAVCPNPESEATLAAREILRHVRAGGRYRDCAILLRSLENHHDAVRRVFERFQIPFFLDRREPVAYHPLAELTRYALRTVALGWEHDDWFGALKTGLIRADEDDLDRLENEALARGWKGDAWQRPVKIASAESLEKWLERLRQQLVPPFQQLSERLAAGPAASPRQPTGPQMAAALREFWNRLRVEETLEKWSAGDADSTARRTAPGALHASVWDQMQSWLDNVALAFPLEALLLRDWLPILEAGLAGLTVGIVPPALDQVLVAAIDRSRNPELQLAIVAGLNESIFPAGPVISGLLTETDRQQLEARGVALAPNKRIQLGHERYYGYVAFTRASKRLVVTCAARDRSDTPLNPSLFLGHLQRLFPGLEPETVAPGTDWRAAEHCSEMVAPLLASLAPGQSEAARPLPPSILELLKSLPVFGPVLQKHRQLAATSATASLPSPLAEQLYGGELRTSVSALEEFAACPFKYFAARGLRAEERREFEADPRTCGDFQHRILEQFHRELEQAGQRWRELSPAEASERIGRIGEELLPLYRDGLFLADQTRRFAAGVLIAGTQCLIETLAAWMPQYGFDPYRVEVNFGLEPPDLPPWRIELDAGRMLVLRGRIDRIDLCRPEGSAVALAVVIDYKSRPRSLDAIKLQHGLELQLLSYLGVLQRFENAGGAPGLPALVPAGGFYVSLKPKRGWGKSREEARANSGQAIRRGFQHSGRFNANWLKFFDNRNESKGDQFKYAIKKKGGFAKRGNDALDGPAFQRLLAEVANHLRRFGNAIYGGDVSVAPFRKGSETACDFCDFRPVCRFDSWVQPYRVLGSTRNPAEARELEARSESP
jgi:ATP-dependent helicase/nuclease subunit B